MNANILETRVVIIGAGLAGIAASINLLESNFDQFLVVEALEVNYFIFYFNQIAIYYIVIQLAEKRIGGRVCTQFDGNKNIIYFSLQFKRVII